MEMQTEMQEEIWHVFKCCKCEKYVDKETRQIVRKPEGKVMSHGYCDDCAKVLRAKMKDMRWRK